MGPERTFAISAPDGALIASADMHARGACAWLRLHARDHNRTFSGASLEFVHDAHHSALEGNRGALDRF